MMFPSSAATDRESKILPCCPNLRPLFLIFFLNRPQPLAYMLEKNREQFPGFRGDEIGDKIHEYDGLQYYAVPRQC